MHLFNISYFLHFILLLNNGFKMEKIIKKLLHLTIVF
jgi:hypothetical protein